MNIHRPAILLGLAQAFADRGIDSEYAAGVLSGLGYDKSSIEKAAKLGRTNTAEDLAEQVQLRNRRIQNMFTRGQSTAPSIRPGSAPTPRRPAGLPSNLSDYRTTLLAAGGPGAISGRPLITSTPEERWSAALRPSPSVASLAGTAPPDQMRYTRGTSPLPVPPVGAPLSHVSGAAPPPIRSSRPLTGEPGMRGSIGWRNPVTGEWTYYKDFARHEASPYYQEPRAWEERVRRRAQSMAQEQRFTPAHASWAARAQQMFGGAPEPGMFEQAGGGPSRAELMAGVIRGTTPRYSRPGRMGASQLMPGYYETMRFLQQLPGLQQQYTSPSHVPYWGEAARQLGGEPWEFDPSTGQVA